MSVAVIAPWGGDCPHRRAAWEWVQGWYAERHPGWEVIQGVCTSDRWCKAEAVADGLRKTSADILVIADADVVADEVGTTVRQIQKGAQPGDALRQPPPDQHPAMLVLELDVVMGLGPVITQEQHPISSNC